MEKTKITVPNGTRDLIFEEVTAERELEGRIDGLLDVLLVRDVSRATVLRVIGKYKAGHYAQLPELIRHFRCRRVHIRCDRESEINLDGELMMSRDVTFEIAPQSIRFFYPRGLTYHAAAEQGGEHIAAT